METDDFDEDDVRFGEVAVRKRYVTALQLHRALSEQRERDARGEPRGRVGEVLLERGWLAPWELEDVLLTLADLASGSSRSGETPSDAIPVGPELYSGGTLYARREGRSIGVRQRAAPWVRRLLRDVLVPALAMSSDTLLGDALDAAFDADAEVVLVQHEGDLAGFVSVWDLCQHDRRTPLRVVLTPGLATLSESAPVAEAVRILGASELPCVVVVSRGELKGVVTRRSLRRAGVTAPELAEPAIAEAELGVGD